MIWKNPHVLWLLLVIPLLLIGQWWVKKRQRDKRKQYFDESLFQQLYKGFWATGSRVKTVCVYISLAFFITAAAGPKIGTKVKKVKREGIELLIALDLSASMNAEDVEPSRLAKAKFEISQLVEQLDGDRVGLIVFTGSAYVQVPLTMDYGAFRMFLDITQTEQMPNTATDIKTAMKLAAKTFAEDNKQATDKHASEVLLIISDGENHGDSYEQALEQLIEQGVRVFTLGVGTREGGKIPIYNNGTIVGYKRNDEGEIIITRLVPGVLKSIAQKGGGEYYEMNNPGSAIDKFLTDVSSLEQGEFTSKRYAAYENQYRWLTMIGLGFLLISMLFPKYRRERVDNKR